MVLKSVRARAHTHTHTPHTEYCHFLLLFLFVCFTILADELFHDSKGGKQGYNAMYKISDSLSLHHLQQSHPPCQSGILVLRVFKCNWFILLFFILWFTSQFNVRGFILTHFVSFCLLPLYGDTSVFANPTGFDCTVESLSLKFMFVVLQLSKLLNH